MDRIGHMLHLDLHGLAGSGHQHLYAGIHPVGLADLLLQRVGATLLGDQRGKRPRSIKLGVHQRDHGLGSEHRQQGHIIRVPLDQFVPKQALCVRWRNNDVYRADLSYGAWIKVTVRLIVPAEREPGESARMCASSGTQRASGSATRGWQQPLSNHQRATIYHQQPTSNDQCTTHREMPSAQFSRTTKPASRLLQGGPTSAPAVARSVTFPTSTSSSRAQSNSVTFVKPIDLAREAADGLPTTGMSGRRSKSAWSVGL
mmetsp:Transcript_5212/g.14907  ORF Transcript_5212/g.14907 Transcript_5212/m.14907 type:complete len:258 (-) Transcript_5212:444-1217(-)